MQENHKSWEAHKITGECSNCKWIYYGDIKFLDFIPNDSGVSSLTQTDVNKFFFQKKPFLNSDIELIRVSKGVHTDGIPSKMFDNFLNLKRMKFEEYEGLNFNEALSLLKTQSKQTAKNASPTKQRNKNPLDDGFNIFSFADSNEKQNSKKSYDKTKKGDLYEH